MNAKSFKVPSKLRFRVRPNANSDIRIRSSAMSAAATPTMDNLSHTASGNTVPSRFTSRIGMTTGSRDRSLMNNRCWRRPIRRVLPYQLTGVIVRQNDPRAVRQQGRLEDFARMDGGRIEGATAHDVVGDHLALRGEAQDPKDLTRLVLQEGGQCGGGLDGRLQCLTDDDGLTRDVNNRRIANRELAKCDGVRLHRRVLLCWLRFLRD